MLVGMRPVTRPYVVKTAYTDLGQCAVVVVRKWDRRQLANGSHVISTARWGDESFNTHIGRIGCKLFTLGGSPLSRAYTV